MPLILSVLTFALVFSASGQPAFADYMSKGGNFAGAHAASVAYMDRPYAPYTNSLGAAFDHHPRRQNATFLKLMAHPATDPIPDQWRYEEEVYSFRTDPRKLGAKALITVDRSSYTGAFLV